MHETPSIAPSEAWRSFPLGFVRAGTCGGTFSRYRPGRVLTDAEAEKIRRGLASGLRGPVLIKWVEQLLADRDERVARERATRRWPGPLAGPRASSVASH